MFRALQTSASIRFFAVLLACGFGIGCQDRQSPPAAVDEDASAEVPLQKATGTPQAVAAPSTSLRFNEVTTEAGVEFTYRNGQEAEQCSIVESLGGGVAFIDYDQDGRPDLFFPGGGEFTSDSEMRGLSGSLFRQKETWKYQAVTPIAGADSAPWYSHGASAADYDNDGFPDLLVTGYGGLVLLHNEGDGTFTVSADTGLIDPLWSSSAGWGDFNGDGVLDLYVAHYVNWSFENHPRCPGPKPDLREICPPRQFDPLPDSLFTGTGDGHFLNTSAEAGLRTDGKGLGVVVADINLDGHADVYVGNDTVPNFLYRGDGQGHFEELGLLSGVSLSHQGTPDGSMGVDVGDFNGDSLPDIWVANYERESFALYRNEGADFFRHISHSLGITAVQQLSVGWGTSFLDADRDGDEDITSSNGHVIRYPEQATLRQFPILFENLEGRRFVNVASQAGEYFSTQHMGRGLATGDLDRDGDTDIAMVHTNERVSLLSNETPNQNHWIGIRLVGRLCNRDAIGAHIIVRTEGGRQQLRLLKSGGSYASTSERSAFFGLGSSEKIDEIEIHWPQGVSQRLGSHRADQYIDVIQPASPQPLKPGP